MKTVQNPSIQSSDYRDLPLTQLVESPTNPRKRYDETSLQELAESIRAQGVLAPLLVRQFEPKRFEIVAGSRRFRAAKLAGMSSVPVRVVRLDDADAIVAQVVENLQRENVHPLEEAHSFRALLDLPDRSFDVPMIAAKSGKTSQYVAARLKLTELIAPVADVFLTDTLTVGHALLIAKLPAAQQAEALRAAFKSTWTTAGQTEVLIPVRELAGWIESNILLDLQTAPFDRTADSLVPEAGSCYECAKRTGANTLLFPESDRDQCLDRECYQIKVTAHIAAAIQGNPQLVQISTAWGTHNNGVLGRSQYVQIVAQKASRNGHTKLPPERKKCSSITPAIVVEGGNCGHTVHICVDPACETHHAESRRNREALERMRTEQRKQDERRKQDLETRRRVLNAILDKVALPLSKADLELIAREFLNRLSNEYRTLLGERHASSATKSKVQKKTDDASLKNLDEAGYGRLLIEIALLDAAYNAYSRDGVGNLEATARRYRINAQKIGESVAAEFAARRRKRLERASGKTNRKTARAAKRTA